MRPSAYALRAWLTPLEQAQYDALVAQVTPIVLERFPGARVITDEMLETLCAELEAEIATYETPGLP